MTPLTQEWVDKAEGDFATAERELEVSVMPNFDAVCFHSQAVRGEISESTTTRSQHLFSKDS